MYDFDCRALLVTFHTLPSGLIQFYLILKCFYDVFNFPFFRHVSICVDMSSSQLTLSAVWCQLNNKAGVPLLESNFEHIFALKLLTIPSAYWNMCHSLRKKKKKSMSPCCVVTEESVKHKINSKTPGLRCRNVLIVCSVGIPFPAPLPPQRSSPHARTQEEEEEEAERRLYFVMSVFLSHFHKTCTGEGKAFQ